ncbi:MAG: hypothetical protein PHX20_01185 [Candidatus Omnitrophica bacterium]|nr:hypothetical protein [Candidatus Omnitrophota bacterium]
MMRRFGILASAIALAIFIGASAFAADDEMDGAEDGWFILETGRITVYYIPGADLDGIEANLRKRATYFTTDAPSEDAPAEEKIRYQLDALFRRAEEVLDMRPANIHIKIRVFRTRRELNDEYCRIFEDAEPRDDLRSFYINKYSTIYTSEEDITDSIIAHEMGHAIVDHYFAVIPPEKVRELLASYVDLHLAE